MTWAEPTVEGWLVRCAAGGGLLLAVGCGLMVRARQPARRQRLGEWGLAAALLAAVLSLGPSWLPVAIPLLNPAAGAAPAPRARANEPAAEEAVSAGVLAPSPQAAAPHADEAGDSAPGRAALPPVPDLLGLAVALTPDSPSLGETPPASADPSSPSWASWLLAAYAFGAVVLLGRWLLGYVGLWRLLRGARPAPEEVVRLYEELAPGPWRPRLLVAPRVRVPLSCGLLRPAVVLPASLCDARAPELRWVLAHELTHLERRDPWTCLLLALGQAVYFYLPWFWWLRRQVQLCQEFVADAAAVAETGQRPEYAQFLLRFTTAPRAPAGATSAAGRTSDLFRRIAMLLQTPGAFERRCPRLWSLAAAAMFLGLAVFVSGVGLRADAAPTQDDPPAKKDEPKKDQKKEEPQKEGPRKDDEPKKDEKKDQPKKDEPRRRQPGGGGFEMPNIEEILKNLPRNLDPEKVEQIRKEMEKMRDEMRKAMEDVRRQIPPDLPGRFQGRFGIGFRGANARLGVILDRPGPALADQLDLPQGQGVVVQQVMPDSAAAKAGLKPHDILLEIAGKPVPSDAAEFSRLLRELKPGTPVDAVVKRKGKQETIKGLTLPEAGPDGPARRRGAGAGAATPLPPPPPGPPARFLPEPEDDL